MNQMKTGFLILALTSLNFAPIAFAQIKEGHGGGEIKNLPAETPSETPTAGEEANPLVKTAPAGESTRSMVCTPKPMSFIGNVPGIRRWAQKWNDKQQTRFAAPINEVILEAGHSEKEFLLTVNTKEGPTAPVSGNIEKMTHEETQKLAWPKKWLNRFRHIDSTSVFQGSWSSPKNETGIPDPQTIRLVKFERTGKKGTEAVVEGTVRIRNQAGKLQKLAVTCTGTLL